MWTNELYDLYEYNSNRVFGPNETPMAPVAHLKTQIVLEIILSENSDFITADIVDPKDAYTIIPVTGEARTSNILPYGLADGLQYIAGDLIKYMPAGYNNTEHHDAYANQLNDWATSTATHRSVRIVNKYIKKGSVISDLIKAGILLLDSNGILLPKQYKREVEKINVRFAIDYTDPELEKRTWLDRSLYDSFAEYNKRNYPEIKLCYATGKMLPFREHHPAQIIKASTYAKLISANDDKNFTFRGKFHNRDEILSVSYEFSEKAHNALKWLIETRGITFGHEKDNTMTLIIWASNMKDIPDIRKTLISDASTSNRNNNQIDPDNDGEYNTDDENIEVAAPTIPEYHKLLINRMFGYGKAFDINDKVMIMSLDTATDGRASMTMYTELTGSEFFKNIEKWHRDTAVKRYSGKTYDSISLIEIANFVYGIELTDSNTGKSKIVCKPKIKETTIMRLLPCITEGRPIPHDIISNLFIKASDPNLYQSESNFKRVNEIALGIIRKDYINKNNYDNTEGDIFMAYNPDLNDRSYLFGCLLAIAHKLEYSTYDEKDRRRRQTNAKRYRRTFSKRPAETWQRIHEKLDSYMRKLDTGIRIYYEKLINEITRKMPESYFTNEPLGLLYVAGYCHFMDYMYTPKPDPDTNDTTNDPSTDPDDDTTGAIANDIDIDDTDITDIPETDTNDISESKSDTDMAIDISKKSDKKSKDKKPKDKKSDKKSKDKKPKDKKSKK